MSCLKYEGISTVDSPEHQQDVGDMVNSLLIGELKLVVCGGYEKDARCDVKLQDFREMKAARGIETYERRQVPPYL